MKLNIQTVVASVMLMATGLANAAEVTVPAGGLYNGLGISGVATLNFSPDFLAALDSSKTAIDSYGAGNAVSSKDTDGYYLEASMTAPVASMTFDSTTNNLLALGTSGGLTLSTPMRVGLSRGGSLTVTDLDINLVSKQVYGNLIGANGVGTVNHVALFNIASITGALLEPGFDSSCGFYNDCAILTPKFTLSGLSLTSEGLSTMSQALGLVQAGSLSIIGITNFGSITATAVPEPATYALMGLGLVGVLIASRSGRRPTKRS